MDITIRYLTRKDQMFWTWQEQGNVVCWHDGQTIGFLHEIIPLLERLAENGLPPFAAIVLFLELTRDQPCLAPLAALRDELKNEQLAGAINELFASKTSLSRFARDRRVSLEAKAILADYFFETSTRTTTAEEAQTIVKQLKNGLGDILELHRVKGDANYDSKSLTAIFQDTVSNLSRVDEDVLDLLQTAGVTELPKVPDIDLAESELAMRLINDLIDDRELSGFAKLTLNLFAAVSLPKSTFFRDELPLGGVSDITNRGPLDRLLLSELANDDITLTARIALNEALYLRREPPFADLPRCKRLLISRGIRSWGLPKYFATAIGLAIIATTDRNTKIQTFSHADSRLIEILLTDRESLIEHLSGLEIDLHPGSAVEELQSQPMESDEPVDSVLIMEESEFSDPQFQQSLVLAHFVGAVVGTVSREGDFHLFHWNHQGVKTIRKTRIDLSELLNSADSTDSFVEKDHDSDLPVIFSLPRFPLRISRPIIPGRHWYFDPGCWLSLTKDRRILVWDNPAHGASQFFQQIPPGNVVFCAIATSQGVAYIVLKDHKRHTLVRIDLEHEQLGVVELKQIDGLKTFLISAGELIGLSSWAAFLIDTETGELKNSHQFNQGVSGNLGRFVQLRDFQWYALSIVSGKLSVEQLTRNVTSNSPEIVAILESPELDEPICLTSGNEIYIPDEDKCIQSGLPHVSMNRLKFSADGNRVLSQQPPHRQQLIFVKNGKLTSKQTYGHPNLAVENPESSQSSVDVNLRKNFTGVTIDSENGLILVSRTGTHLAIRLRSHQILLQIIGTKQGAAQALFKPVGNLNPGCRLQVAELAGGGKVFLDSRGMIHLKPANDRNDEDIPETTIVLHEGMTSGWCSNGKMWGQEYFICDQESAPTDEIFRQSIEPFFRQQIV